MEELVPGRLVLDVADLGQSIPGRWCKSELEWPTVGQIPNLCQGRSHYVITQQSFYNPSTHALHFLLKKADNKQKCSYLYPDYSDGGDDIIGIDTYESCSKYKAFCQLE